MSLWAAPAQSQSSEAQCTCDIKGNDRRNGAEVRNARSCFSTEIADDEWCNIDVDELNSSGGYATVIARIEVDLAAGAGPENVVNDVFNSYLNFQSSLEQPTVPPEALNGLFAVAESAIFNSTEALTNCAKSYLEFVQRDQTETKVFEGDGLLCFISGMVGWMHISIPANGVVLTLHLAPPV